MKRYLLLIACLFPLLSVCAQKQHSLIPLPSAAQLEWQNKERVMFVHFGPAAFQGREYDNNSSDIKKMYLSKLNTDQWCQVAKSWGAKMIIFVAKHCGGFCWWQTKTTDYGVSAIPWKQGKGDVMKDLSASCKKYGLDLGVYVYPGDEHWGAGIGSGGITKDPSKQQAYNEVYRTQLKELLTRYGTIKEVWFDGNCRISVKDILQQYAPKAVFFQGECASIRWVGNEDGFAPDPNWYTINTKDLKSGSATALHSDINGDAYAPVEVDVPFLRNGGHKWFWAPNTDSLLMNKDQLMDLYYKSVGRGALLLLNSSPDTTGLIAASHVRLYKIFGDEINRRFGKSIAETKGHCNVLKLAFSRPTLVNHVVTEENLQYGQRILSYKIEGSADGKHWSQLYAGTSVGHKKIDYFATAKVRYLRLTVLSAKALPYITKFAAYHIAVTPSQQRQQEITTVGYWQGNTYDSEKWTALELNLTPYMNKIGQYDICFTTHSYDYSDNRPSGLEFKDVKLQMYGHDMTTAVTKVAPNKFRIDRSQQTLNDYPIKLTMMVKSRPCKSAGEITIQRVTF